MTAETILSGLFGSVVGALLTSIYLEYRYRVSESAAHKKHCRIMILVIIEDFSFIFGIRSVILQIEEMIRSELSERSDYAKGEMDKPVFKTKSEFEAVQQSLSEINIQFILEQRLQYTSHLPDQLIIDAMIYSNRMIYALTLYRATISRHGQEITLRQMTEAFHLFRTAEALAPKIIHKLNKFAKYNSSELAKTVSGTEVLSFLFQDQSPP